MSYQPKTGQKCHCKPGVHRDNCPDCEGTGWRINFAAIRASTTRARNTHKPENTLWDVIKASGIEYDSHETDLYFPVTEQTTAILAAFPVQQSIAQKFSNQRPPNVGQLWYDVPFAYLPAWEAKKH